jgi:hypothetical protein
VVYGPLAEAPVAPDVVLLFVRADQTLILSEASQSLKRMPPAMDARRAIILQATVTGRTALSLAAAARAPISTS